jgi:hypothetical protein
VKEEDEEPTEEEEVKPEIVLEVKAEDAGAGNPYGYLGEEAKGIVVGKKRKRDQDDEEQSEE